MRQAEFNEAIVAVLERLADPPEDPGAAEARALKASIARIEKMASAARANWFWYFGILAYALITLMGVRDAALFSTETLTTLPVLNFQVNLRSFMIFGPILVTVVYIYLHGMTERMWRDIGDLPARVDGFPVVVRLPVWLVIDFALLVRRGRRTGERREGLAPPSWLGLMGASATGLLVWAGGPLVVLWFWLRTFVMHDLAVSLTQALCLLLCVATGWISFSALWRAMGTPPDG